MRARKPVFKVSPSNPDLGEIQTQPERKPDMPYAPAIRVTAPGDPVVISDGHSYSDFVCGSALCSLQLAA